MLVLFLTKLSESHDGQMIFTNHTAIDLTEVIVYCDVSYFNIGFIKTTFV